MEFEHMLTKGAVKSMIHNENPNDSVVQILDIKPYTSGGEKKNCVVISDGIHLHSLCVLTSNLNKLIFSGELESFGIVKIKNYIITVIACMEINKILTIKDLVMLIPGKVVRSIIGNPQAIPAFFYQRSMVHGPVINPADMENFLTKGSLRSIMNNVDIKNAILQVFDFKIFLTSTSGIYHVTISDGENSISITGLDALTHKIISGQINEFSVIVLKRYMINEFFDHAARLVKHLTIIDFDILACGNVVVSKIGNPQQINENALVDTFDDSLSDALNMMDCFDNLNIK